MLFSEKAIMIVEMSFLEYRSEIGQAVDRIHATRKGPYKSIIPDEITKPLGSRQVVENFTGE